MKGFISELETYAAIGIEAEIARLNALLQSMRRAITEEAAVETVADSSGEAVAKRRKRPPMSAAARKAISRRMKARWAAKKAEK